MAEKYNEGKVIDAVLRCIEAREGASRLDDGWSPDDQRDPDKDRRVDYVCTVGRQLYAFEHTGIEPFENQIEMEVHSRELFEPVMAHFGGAPNGEYWELHTPVEAPVGLSGKKIKQAQTALIKWISVAAVQTSPSCVCYRSAGSAIDFRAMTTGTPGRACTLASLNPIPGGRCTRD